MTAPNVEAIRAIRHSLGFGAAEEAAVREASKRLAPEVEGWVDRFYVRLLTDPAAMRVIGDEASVIRLKRSLTAWFLEMFSLPVDEAYQRAREEIGKTHVRRGMPLYLMVTSMGALKRDVAESVARLWGNDEEGRARVGRALDMVLDVELALMLGAYRRRAHEVTAQVDRALQRMRLANRHQRATRDAVDAALCYAELVRRSTGEEKERWAARLDHALRAVLRAGEAAGGGLPGAEEPLRRVRLSDLLADSLTDAQAAGQLTAEMRVSPPDLEATVRPVHLRLGLEELVRNVERHAPGATVRLSAHADGPGAIVVEVTDTGPGWPSGVRTLEDLDRPDTASGLDAAASAARAHGGTLELFEAPGGGAGVRIRIPVPVPVHESGATSDASVVAGTRRRPA